MLKLRNYKYNSLYDFKVTKKDAVEISKLKPGEKPSILSDTMFKTMCYNDSRLKYSAKFYHIT